MFQTTNQYQYIYIYAIYAMVHQLETCWHSVTAARTNHYSSDVATEDRYKDDIPIVSPSIPINPSLLVKLGTIFVFVEC